MRGPTAKQRFTWALTELALVLGEEVLDARFDAYWKLCCDLPIELLERAIEAAGRRKWYKFPQPAELREIAERFSRREDISDCLDCGGTGFTYPHGIERGAARCRHTNRVERVPESRRLGDKDLRRTVLEGIRKLANGTRKGFSG